MEEQDRQAAVDIASETAPVKSPRLQSLDALRGFTMLWIIGAAEVIRAGATCIDKPWLNRLAEQMHHVSWEGFRFYDLIFPMFLFIAGVSIPLSLASQRKRGLSEKRIFLRTVRRGLLLVVLGVVYNGGLALAGMENTRFASVLGLIGIGYIFAFIIVMNLNIRGQIICCAAILLGYWLALMWIPVPEFGSGQLTAEGSLASYVDRMLLPGKPYGTVYDPEGILQSISAVSMALIGAMAGQWLMRPDLSQRTKALGLLLGGAGLVADGVIWGLFYPVIKSLWTGSFILLAAGLSMLLLSVFYWIIDCVGLKKWAFGLVVVGMNSITIYMAARIIDFGHMSHFLFGGIANLTPEPSRDILFYLGVVLLEWLFLYFLYRKKVFLKL